jgi:hypothetical protein
MPVPLRGVMRWPRGFGLRPTTTITADDGCGRILQALEHNADY